VILSLLALCVLLVGSAQAAPVFSDPAADVDRIVELSLERRALMREVAAWKWLNQRPIADPEREQELLRRMIEQGRTLGIEADGLEGFFKLQIKWGRREQKRAFAEWRRTQANVVAPRDLHDELRPALDRVGVELLQALYLALPEIATDDFEERYAPRVRRFEGLTAEEAAALLKAMSELRPVAVPALARIRASGVLRVGLPGDYAPFAVERDGVLVGADVQLSLAFAAQERLRVRFVRTSWAQLARDFQANRFDIAAGGISVTPERAAIAAFAPSYRTVGKTPLVRCGEETRFDTLAEIDQPHVRVVTNPGGSNERFVREHLKQADILVHPDNRTIFAQLVMRNADVMITDDIEADLQARVLPGLCRATRETFAQSEKAWMVRRDPTFLAEVNTWMEQAIRTGKVREAFDAAMQVAVRNVALRSASATPAR
jgi:cyclohexadienyl dehydratase